MVLITPNLVFHLLDLIVGIVLFIGACYGFFGSFEGVFLPIYLILFAVVILVAIFWLHPRLSAMIPFYFNFLGRGLTFLFFGCIILIFQIACGVIIVIVAFIYIVLWIVVIFTKIPCELPPPIVSGKPKEETTTTATTTTVVTSNDNPDFNNNDVNNGNPDMTSTEPR